MLSFTSSQRSANTRSARLAARGIRLATTPITETKAENVTNLPESEEVPARIEDPGALAPVQPGDDGSARLAAADSEVNTACLSLLILPDTHARARQQRPALLAACRTDAVTVVAVSNLRRGHPGHYPARGYGGCGRRRHARGLAGGSWRRGHHDRRVLPTWPFRPRRVRHRAPTWTPPCSHTRAQGTQGHIRVSHYGLHSGELSPTCNT